MKKYIATFSDLLEEEIDINGFCVMTAKEIEDYEEKVTEITWNFEIKLNNSQKALQYSNGEELLSRIEFKPITEEEYKTFKRLFNGTFGTFINTSLLLQVLGDEEDFDIEDEVEDDD